MLWKLDNVTLHGTHGDRVRSMSKEIDSGRTAVIGYSGAGKTSLLNLLVGFEQPDSGSITSSIEQASGERLPLYWVPQDGGLWPHLNVRQHLDTVNPADSQCESTDQLLTAFDLNAVADSYPETLSPGERSRLSVARALATQASVLVMDEPLSHVDPARIRQYWTVIRESCATHSSSLVFATHNPECVLRDAETVICLRDGVALYAGSVDELYHRPETPELANFLGPCNWLSPEDVAVWLDDAGQHDSCCLRPEQLKLRRDNGGRFRVIETHFAGTFTETMLTDERTRSSHVFIHRPMETAFGTGDSVVVQRTGNCRVAR